MNNETDIYFIKSPAVFNETSITTNKETDSPFTKSSVLFNEKNVKMNKKTDGYFIGCPLFSESNGETNKETNDSFMKSSFSNERTVKMIKETDGYCIKATICNGTSRIEKNVKSDKVSDVTTESVILSNGTSVNEKNIKINKMADNIYTKSSGLCNETSIIQQNFKLNKVKNDDFIKSSMYNGSSSFENTFKTDQVIDNINIKSPALFNGISRNEKNVKMDKAAEIVKTSALSNSNDTMIERNIEIKKVADIADSPDLSNDTLWTETTINTEKGTDDIIIQRLLNLANTHVNMGFKSILNEIYIAKYGEYVPHESLEAIKFCVTLDQKVTEPLISNKEQTSDKENQCILYQNGYTITATAPSVSKPERSDKSNRIIPKQNGYTTITKPKALKPHEIGNIFWVKIYNCKSVMEIWGKIMNVNHLVKMEELSSQMQSFYDSENLVASSVTENSFYAVFDRSWHRVKCLKCDESNAVILFIDRGDEATFPVTKLCMLDQKFCSLPAQAFKMSLSGLEIFSDCDDLHAIMNDLLDNKNVFANAMNLNETKNNCLTVQLYLKIYEESINVVDLITEQLFKTVLDPKCDIQVGEIIPVHISHVSEKRTFIQLNTKSFKYFTMLMKETTEKYLNDENLKQQMLTKVEEYKIYFVENHEDKKWYRARILKVESENKIQALLIDTGLTISIKIEDCILLEKLCSIFAKYPEQAIEVQVDQLSVIYDYRTLERLRNLISITDAFYVKFTTLKWKSDNNNVLTVKLLKKEPNDLLTQINDSLLLNKNSDKRSMNDVFYAKKSAIDICALQLQSRSNMWELNKSLSIDNDCKLLSLSSILDPPNVAKGYCDVHVVVAIDPSQFVVQLLRNKSLELKKMEHEVSKVCSSYRGPKLTYKTIQVGQLYACKYDEYDQQWYRVYLIEIIDIKIATIYYCDYGYFKDVNIENLVLLHAEFHKLPYQAIWAELYGIIPASELWTADDCSRFKDLTQSKNFVCTIVSKKNFKPNKNNNLRPIMVETVYRLELIDTSTVEDVDIADILIDERRAVRN